MDRYDIERAAIYYRYSSAKDAQVENSQQRQEDMVKDFCIKNGDDSVSGDKDKPQLMELKRAVEEKQILIDVIVVSMWARLTRKEILDFHEDVQWIRNAGIKVAIQQENRIFDLSDQNHSIELGVKVNEANRFLKTLSSNVRSGMEAKFRRGTLGYGRPPFGFDRDTNGKWIPNADMPLVKEIFDTFLSSSVIACVPIMRKAKRYQESGKAPSSTAVKTVLRNTIYIGMRTFAVAGTGRHGTIRGNKTSGSRNVNRLKESALEPLDVRHEIAPVIDDDVFEKAQKILDENKKRRPKRITSKYKYSGFVRCSCGCKLIADKRKKHVNYVCPKSKNLKAGCDVDIVGRKCLRENEITAIVRELSNVILRDMDFHLAVLDNMVNSINRKMTAKSIGGVEKMRRIEQMQKRKSQMWETMERIDDADYDAAQQAIENLSNRIKAEKESLNKEDIEIDELLNLQFEETQWDVTGNYLNRMIELAKTIADKEKAQAKKGDEVFIDENGEDDVLPEESWNNLVRYIEVDKAHQKDIRAIINDLMHGNEHSPLLSLIDEITVNWRKVDGRCRPYKVACRWKVNATTSSIDIGKEDKMGFGRRLQAALNGGAKASMDVLVVLYPTRGRAIARLERA